MGTNSTSAVELSSDDDLICVRWKRPVDSSEGQHEDEEDDDVMIIDESQFTPSSRQRRVKQKIEPAQAESDEDCCIVAAPAGGNLAETVFTDGDELVVVGESGQVACRDFPHARHLCVRFPFKTSSPLDFCEQCHCYVCDIIAPCSLWTVHCYASDKDERWNTLRKSRNKAPELAVLASVAQTALVNSPFPSAPFIPNMKRPRAVPKRSAGPVPRTGLTMADYALGAVVRGVSPANMRPSLRPSLRPSMRPPLRPPSGGTTNTAPVIVPIGTAAAATTFVRPAILRRPPFSTGPNASTTGAASVSVPIATAATATPAVRPAMQTSYRPAGYLKVTPKKGAAVRPTPAGHPTTGSANSQAAQSSGQALQHQTSGPLQSSVPSSATQTQRQHRRLQVRQSVRPQFRRHSVPQPSVARTSVSVPSCGQNVASTSANIVSRPLGTVEGVYQTRSAPLAAQSTLQSPPAVDSTRRTLSYPPRQRTPAQQTCSTLHSAPVHHHHQTPTHQTRGTHQAPSSRPAAAAAAGVGDDASQAYEGQQSPASTSPPFSRAATVSSTTSSTSPEQQCISSSNSNRLQVASALADLEELLGIKQP